MYRGKRICAEEDRYVWQNAKLYHRRWICIAEAIICLEMWVRALDVDVCRERQICFGANLGRSRLLEQTGQLSIHDVIEARKLVPNKAKWRLVKYKGQKSIRTSSS